MQTRLTRTASSLNLCLSQPLPLQRAMTTRATTKSHLHLLPRAAIIACYPASKNWQALDLYVPRQDRTPALAHLARSCPQRTQHPLALRRTTGFHSLCRTRSAVLIDRTAVGRWVSATPHRYLQRKPSVRRAGQV